MDKKIKTSRQIKKEVKNELQRITEKAEKKDKKVSSKKAPAVKSDNGKIFEFAEDVQKMLEKEIVRLKSATSEEVAAWVIDKHDAFCETLMWLTTNDFLGYPDYESRYMKLVYMIQLNELLATYDVEFNKEIANIIAEKGYADLFEILKVLNYI